MSCSLGERAPHGFLSGSFPFPGQGRHQHAQNKGKPGWNVETLGTIWRLLAHDQPLRSSRYTLCRRYQMLTPAPGAASRRRDGLRRCVRMTAGPPARPGSGPWCRDLNASRSITLLRQVCKTNSGLPEGRRVGLFVVLTESVPVDLDSALDLSTRLSSPGLPAWVLSLQSRTQGRAGGYPGPGTVLEAPSALFPLTLPTAHW